MRWAGSTLARTREGSCHFRTWNKIVWSEPPLQTPETCTPYSRSHPRTRKRLDSLCGFREAVTS